MEGVSSSAMVTVVMFGTVEKLSSNCKDSCPENEGGISIRGAFQQITAEDRKYAACVQITGDIISSRATIDKAFLVKGHGVESNCTVINHPVPY